MKKVQQLLDVLGKIEKLLLGAVFSFLVCVICYQIIVRWLGFQSLRWVEELCQYVYVCSVMMGCSIGITEDGMMKVSALEEALPKKYSHILKGCVNILCGIFSGYLSTLAYSTGSLMLRIKSVTTALRMPIGAFYLFVSVCLIGWCIRSLLRAVLLFTTLNEKEG